jgi:hypothetical protein
MSNQPIAYRARIRDASTVANPNGTTDVLVVSSVRGDAYPWIAAPFTGDGQELDPLTGAVRTGSYRVTLVDAIVSGTNRVFTRLLYDASGRQTLLSRRVYLEQSVNGGVAWTPILAGYLMNYRLADAITWELTIGDSRRIEQNKIVFDGTSTIFTQRGCLFGGPIVGGFGGPNGIKDRGGWTFKVQQIGAITPPSGTGTVIGLEFQSGFKGTNDPRTNRLRNVVNFIESSNDFSDNISDAAFPYYDASAFNGFGGYTGLIAYIAEKSAAFTPVPAFWPGGASPRGNLLTTIAHTTASNLQIMWPVGMTLPSVGDIFTISCYAKVASDVSPVYITEHPVDLITKLWTEANIVYDASVAATVRAALGDTLRLSMRVTASTKLDAFLEANIFGPFGLAARVNTIGALELIQTRSKTTTVPTGTINTSDLADASPVVFDADESTVISTVRFKTQVYTVYDSTTGTTSSGRPLDSVLVTESEVISTSGDLSTYGTKEVSYDIKGMIHDAAGFVSNPQALILANGLEIFDRFGHSAPTGEVRVLRASDPLAYVGDLLYIQPAHFPNLNKRYGDDNSVGARVMQVVRRTEAPEGPTFKLLDAGSAQQPVTPAATVTIAATSLPQATAAFTITNAAAINATALLKVAVQWGTGSSAPSGGFTLIRYDVGACPTTAVTLPQVAAATKVWVRARTEQDGRLPSAWTSWVSVTLNAIGTPNTPTISNIQQNAAQVNWTNTVATDLVDVFVAPGSVAPSDWTSYFIATMPAGSLSATVRNLNGPTVNYIAGIRYRDPNTGGVGAIVTVTFTTNSTLGTATVPLGFLILPTVADASLPSGVVVSLYAGDATCDFVIERAPDVSGSPGTYAIVGQVPGSTKIFYDRLPLDGAVRWYRVKARLTGLADSAYVAALSAIPSSMPSNVAQPPFVTPQLAIQFTLVSTNANGVTFSVTVTDPLNSLTTCTVTPTYAGLSLLRDLTTGVGAVAYTATIGVARSFQLIKNPAFQGMGYAKFAATSVGRYPAYVHWFADHLDQQAAPASVITIGASQSPTTPTALVSATVNAPDNCDHILWLASTSAYPSQASVVTSGATVSGGSPFQIASLGVALALGDTVYLSWVTVDALGVITGIVYHAQATRFQTSAMRTTRYNASAFFMPYSAATLYTILPWAYSPSGFSTTVATASRDSHFCPLPVPQSATIKAVRLAYDNFGTNSVVDMLLYRNDAAGSSVQLGSTQTITGPGSSSLQVGSLTELASSARSYQIQANTAVDTGGGFNPVNLMWFEIDTEVSSVLTNL